MQANPQGVKKIVLPLREPASPEPKYPHSRRPLFGK